MSIFHFRPYKRWGNEEIIDEIDKVSQYVNQLGKRDPEKIQYLNELFCEAKARRLELGIREYCNKILYSTQKK